MRAAAEPSRVDRISSGQASRSPNTRHKAPAASVTIPTGSTIMCGPLHLLPSCFPPAAQHVVVETQRFLGDAVDHEPAEIAARALAPRAEGVAVAHQGRE